MERKIIEIVTDTCPECQGQRVVSQEGYMRCRQCGKLIEWEMAQTLLDPAAKAPRIAECGHSPKALQEEWECTECEGQGTVTRERDVTALLLPRDDAPPSDPLEACYVGVFEAVRPGPLEDEENTTTELVIAESISEAARLYEEWRWGGTAADANLREVKLVGFAALISADTVRAHVGDLLLVAP